MIFTETQERFVKAIAAQVPLEQVAEIHFFQPIRQGGVESGVAVIATRPDPSSHPGRNERSPVPPPTDAEVAPSATDGSATTADVPEVESLTTHDETLATLGDDPEAASDLEVEVPVNVETGELSPPEPEAPAPPASPDRERHVIYTARYRLTLKGPDRGKWETTVVAEADAPLLTVDAVVRGVQRRSGDVEDPIRLTGDELLAVTHRAQHPAA